MASPLAVPKYTAPFALVRSDERNHTSLSTRPSWRVTPRRIARAAGSIWQIPPLVPTQSDPSGVKAMLQPLLANRPSFDVSCAVVLTVSPSIANTPFDGVPTHSVFSFQTSAAISGASDQACSNRGASTSKPKLPEPCPAGKGTAVVATDARSAAVMGCLLR